MKKITLLFCTFFCLQIAQAQGYDIRVKIDNYNEKMLLLGFPLGDKQYVKDTSRTIENGYFVFKKDKELESGVYFIFMQPDNKFFEILIEKGKQNIKLTSDAKEPYEKTRFENSPDNAALYDYMDFIEKRKKVATEMRASMKKDSADDTKRKNWEDKLSKIEQEVKNYQWKFVEKNPNSFSSLLVKGAIDVDIPEMKGKDDDDTQYLKYVYYKRHFFDNFNMTDPRLLRTRLLFPRINNYIERLTPKNPDSINASLDRVLDMLKPNNESFKFYAIHFLNQYAKSNIIGHDACYVHLVKKYFENGVVELTDKENLNKIIQNANTLEPVLIGKIAPDIEMFKRDGSKIRLYDVKAKYTILMFWRYDCGHCKESMPKVMEFYKNYKSKDIEIFSVCTKLGEETPKCWDFIDEKKEMNWINVIDTYHLSRCQTIYDVKVTPMVYILNDKKEIILKKVNPEELGEVMDDVMRVDNLKLSEKNDKK